MTVEHPALQDDYATDFESMVVMGIARTYVQGARSMDTKGKRCAYDGSGGRRCVVGHMMAEEQLDKYGGYICGALGLPYEALSFPPVTSERENILVTLQQAHDFRYHPVKPTKDVLPPLRDRLKAVLRGSGLLVSIKSRALGVIAELDAMGLSEPGQ